MGGTWDVNAIAVPKEAKPKAKVVTLMLAPGVRAEVTKRGTCKTCDEEILYARNYGMWLHKDYMKGKRYEHQGKPR